MVLAAAGERPIVGRMMAPLACVRCGAELRPSAKFCDECGSDLRPNAVSATPAEYKQVTAWAETMP